MSSITVCCNEEKIILSVNDTGNISLNDLRQHFPNADGLSYKDENDQIHTLTISLEEIIIRPDVKKYDVSINSKENPEKKSESTESAELIKNAERNSQSTERAENAEIIKNPEEKLQSTERAESAEIIKNAEENSQSTERAKSAEIINNAEENSRSIERAENAENKLETEVNNDKQSGPQTRDKLVSEDTVKTPSESDKQSLKTLRIGWLHKSSTSKKFMKMKKPLGGVRRLKLDESQSYKAEDIRKMAIKEFSTNENYCGIEDYFIINLGLFGGRVITDFQLPNGEICDIWIYCLAQKTTLYKLDLFILTTPKNGTDPLLLGMKRSIGNGRPMIKRKKIKAVNSVYVFYHYVRMSKYSNETIYTECQKNDLHIYFLEEQYGDGPPIELFEPLDYGHTISRIKIKDKDLLQIYINEDSTKIFQFPSAQITTTDNVHVIVHDTDELQGVCNGTYGIGMIPSCTDACRPIFTWYKDGVLYRKGEFLYWLSDVYDFWDGKAHTWSCSVSCQGSDIELKSKEITLK